MDYGNYVRQLDRDIRAMVAALVDVDLSTGVPSCPGWSLKDLAVHLAEGYQHKIEAIRHAARPDPWPPDPPGGVWGAPVLEFLEASGEALLAELRRRDPRERCWTWYPEDQTVGFWARRMAQETVIHRWDAESAVAHTTSIDAAIAADGIDELLVVFLSGDWSDEPQPGPFGDVNVITGSTGWRVGLTADAVEVNSWPRSAGRRPPAAAQLDGTEEGLLLWLWGRGSRSPRVMGDPVLVDGLRHRLSLVSQ